MVSCAGSVDISRQSLKAGATYVAMGSSYAAGPDLGQPKPDMPKRCSRDNGSYPSLLAARLKLNLIDATCSGATTAHILGPWNELSPQIDALTPETRLVTITIGGNDINYVRNLYVATCDSVKMQRVCPPLLIPTNADWTKLEADLRKIADEVRLRAPKAKLVFVDYVTLVPEGKLCSSVPMTDASAQTMRQIAAQFAAVTAKAAHESGAELLNAGELSKQHTPCDADPWSIGTLMTPGTAPWHPNNAGMRGIARALASKLVG
ncbi:hypothetical protein IP81_07315 [Novosphingobium sp. AAP83]|nr:hypothetical protein IP81_07315 [Novosphingobium sp. AAP83]